MLPINGTNYTLTSTPTPTPTPTLGNGTTSSSMANTTEREGGSKAQDDFLKQLGQHAKQRFHHRQTRDTGSKTEKTQMNFSWRSNDGGLTQMGVRCQGKDSTGQKVQYAANTYTTASTRYGGSKEANFNKGLKSASCDMMGQMWNLWKVDSGLTADDINNCNRVDLHSEGTWYKCTVTKDCYHKDGSFKSTTTTKDWERA